MYLTNLQIVSRLAQTCTKSDICPQDLTVFKRAKQLNKHSQKQNNLALKCPSLTKWRCQYKTPSPPPCCRHQDPSKPPADSPLTGLCTRPSLDGAPPPGLEVLARPGFGHTELRRKPGRHVFAKLSTVIEEYNIYILLDVLLCSIAEYFSSCAAL